MRAGLIIGEGAVTGCWPDGACGISIGCSTQWCGAACNLEWLGFEHLAHRTRSKVSVTMKVPGLPRVASGENAMYGAYLHLLSKSGTLSRRHRCAERKAEAQKNCARFALIRTRAFEKCFSSRVGPCSYLWGEGVGAAGPRPSGAAGLELPDMEWLRRCQGFIKNKLKLSNTEVLGKLNECALKRARRGD